MQIDKSMPGVSKSVILSTVVSVCFIFSLEMTQATAPVPYGWGCRGGCQLCLECPSKSREQLRLALLLILKMCSPVSHAGAGACCSKLCFGLCQAMKALHC